MTHLSQGTTSCGLCRAIEVMDDPAAVVALHREMRGRGVQLHAEPCGHIAVQDESRLTEMDRTRLRAAQKDRRLWALVMADELTGQAHRS